MYGDSMDRRQEKTRRAIFAAFADLLAKKEFSKITVGEIIALANVGRATFYAHFETKDYLLKALCQELFCHILDGADSDHRHIFDCQPPESVFLHLLQHFQKNDNNLLLLLTSPNNGLFLEYFKDNLKQLVLTQLPRFAERKSECLPESFWVDHIASTFVETVRWWVDNGMTQDPETIAQYFYLAV